MPKRLPFSPQYHTHNDTLTFTMETLSRCCKYRQLSILKLHSSVYSQLAFWFSSWLTMAMWSPMGSRPMARQNRITCITGSAKMNSITLLQWYRIIVWVPHSWNMYCINSVHVDRTHPTFLHIRRKFFCRSARIFPLVVSWQKSPQSGSSIDDSDFTAIPVLLFIYQNKQTVCTKQANCLHKTQ
jgi:hypothetical protein